MRVRHRNDYCVVTEEGSSGEVGNIDPTIAGGTPLLGATVTHGSD